MSLSEIIAKLELDESIHFTSHLMEIGVVIEKGDHPKNRKAYQFFVNRSDAEAPCRAIDVIAHEVDRSLQIIRRRGENPIEPPRPRPDASHAEQILSVLDRSMLDG